MNRTNVLTGRNCYLILVEKELDLGANFDFSPESGGTTYRRAGFWRVQIPRTNPVMRLAEG
jgi:hypothetical protein